MRFLYLRTVFWFGLESGGSVGHTSGVINNLSRHAQLDVVSNDFLEGVHPEISIVSPTLLKHIPFRFGELFYNLVLINKLKKTIQNYDVIYHRYSGLTFSAAFLSKKFGVPLILEFNSSDVWKLKNWAEQSFWIATLIARVINSLKIPIVARVEKYNIENSHLITVPSEPLKETLIKTGISENRIMVNPNGVDQNVYCPEVSGEKIKAGYGLENSKVIGFIGTFGQWHGVIEMAKSIELFFNLYPENLNKVKFLLIGDGRLMPSVKNIIEKSGYKDNVIFTGLIPQSKGPEYLAACDILLSPHIKNPDGSKFFGSPTKLFEYMAMGKAIIASDLDQIGEVLEHRKTSYLVKPGDIKQLAETMQLLLNDPELRDNLARNARSEVLQKYTWEKHVDKMLAKIASMNEMSSELKNG